MNIYFIVVIVLVVLYFFLLACNVYLQKARTAQIGSTCGFYALNNALSELGYPKKTQAEMLDIIKKCHERGLTIVGEIFDHTTCETIIKDYFPEVYNHMTVIKRIDSYNELKNKLRNNDSFVFIPVGAITTLHYILIRTNNGNMQSMDPGRCKWVRLNQRKFKKYISRRKKHDHEEFNWKKYFRKQAGISSIIFRSCGKLMAGHELSENYNYSEKMHKDARNKTLSTSVNSGDVIYLIKREA